MAWLRTLSKKLGLTTKSKKTTKGKGKRKLRRKNRKRVKKTKKNMRGGFVRGGSVQSFQNSRKCNGTPSK